MEQLRKEGNELFKCGDYEGALTAYTQALGLGATPQDQAILHRNRAACHLKLVREPAALPLPLLCPAWARFDHLAAVWVLAGCSPSQATSTYLSDVFWASGWWGLEWLLEPSPAAQLVP